MMESKKQTLNILIYSRVKMIVNPKLGNLLTKNTIENIKIKLINDPILKQCTKLHFDVLQHKTDPMRLQISDISKNGLDPDWKKL